MVCLDYQKKDFYILKHVNFARTIGVDKKHFDNSKSTDNESSHLDCEHPINRIHSNLVNPNKYIHLSLHLIKVPTFAEILENHAITLILLLKKIRLLISFKVVKKFKLSLMKSKMKT